MNPLIIPWRKSRPPWADAVPAVVAQSPKTNVIPTKLRMFSSTGVTSRPRIARSAVGVRFRFSDRGSKVGHGKFPREKTNHPVCLLVPEENRQVSRFQAFLQVLFQVGQLTGEQFRVAEGAGLHDRPFDDRDDRSEE